MSKTYHNGELITKDRMQDEPWYSDWSSVVNIMTAGPDPDQPSPSFFERVENGRQLALEACKKYFRNFPGPKGWVPPSDERLMRWIDGMWSTEAQMQRIDREYAKEQLEKEDWYKELVRWANDVHGKTINTDHYIRIPKDWLKG